MELVAQHCKKARLSLEATQAVNQHDVSRPQHESKVASSWVPEQQPILNITQDTGTPELGGVGLTMQHKTRIKPNIAVAIDTAADQKCAEQMVQPDPDPDQVAAVSSSADGVSFTDDLPTICDGNPNPMEGVGLNEDIPADAPPIYANA